MILQKIRLAKTVAGLNSPESEMSKMFQSFNPENRIEYHNSPRTTIGGTYENLDKPARYKPSATFSLNLMELDEFNKFYDVINTRSFFIEYDDFFGRVRRNVYLSDFEKNIIIRSRTKFDFLSGLKFTFISRLGYRMTDAQGNDIGMDFLKMNLLTDVDGRF